jgi:hypothetical protein
MLIVRDRRDGHAVSWGTDHDHMREIAQRSPHFYAIEDRAASAYYCHVQRPVMSAAWVHPYDLSAQEEAEIKP